MKKSLLEAGMTESESQVAKKTMKQGIQNVQPFSMSIAKISLKKSIPYVVVLDIQTSEPKS